MSAEPQSSSNHLEPEKNTLQKQFESQLSASQHQQYNALRSSYQIDAARKFKLTLSSELIDQFEKLHEKEGTFSTIDTPTSEEKGERKDNTDSKTSPAPNTNSKNDLELEFTTFSLPATRSSTQIVESKTDGKINPHEKSHIFIKFISMVDSISFEPNIVLKTGTTIYNFFFKPVQKFVLFFSGATETNVSMSHSFPNWLANDINVLQFEISKRRATDFIAYMQGTEPNTKHFKLTFTSTMSKEEQSFRWCQTALLGLAISISINATKEVSASNISQIKAEILSHSHRLLVLDHAYAGELADYSGTKCTPDETLRLISELNSVHNLTTINLEGHTIGARELNALTTLLDNKPTLRMIQLPTSSWSVAQKQIWPRIYRNRLLSADRITPALFQKVDWHMLTPLDLSKILKTHTSLHALDFSSQQLKSDHWILDHDYWPDEGARCAFTHLSFKNNQLGDEGAKKLAQLIRNKPFLFSNLKSIDLSDNAIGDHGMLALMHELSQLKKLETCIFDNNNLTSYDRGFIGILEYMKNHPTMINLSLRQNRIVQDNKKIIGSSLKTLTKHNAKLPKTDITANYFYSEHYPPELLKLLEELMIFTDSSAETICDINLVKDGKHWIFNIPNQEPRILDPQSTLYKALIEYQGHLHAQQQYPQFNEIFEEIKTALARVKTENPSLSNYRPQAAKELDAQGLKLQRQKHKLLLTYYDRAPLKAFLQLHPILRVDRIQEAPCLIDSTKTITPQEWRVYYIGSSEHASLLWEGLYSYGQREFGGAHLQALDGIPKISFFNKYELLSGLETYRKSDISTSYVIPKKDVEKMVNAIQRDTENFLDRSYSSSLISRQKKADNPVTNCEKWALEKLAIYCFKFDKAQCDVFLDTCYRILPKNALKELRKFSMVLPISEKPESTPISRSSITFFGEDPLHEVKHLPPHAGITAENTTSTTDVDNFQKGMQHLNLYQLQEASPLLQLAAQNNYPPAYLFLFMIADLKQNKADAKKWLAMLAVNKKWFVKHAQHGDLQGMYYLGLYHFCIEKQNPNAIIFLRYAADLWHANAQFELGKFYELEENAQVAFQWYERAASQGHPGAQWALGECFRNGFGVEQNHTNAVMWYRKACDQGHAKAANTLANCYLHGHGVDRSTHLASTFFERAAQLGYESTETTLDLSKANLSKEELPLIKTLLKLNPKTQTLNLANNNFGIPGSLEELNAYIKIYPRIEKLDLSNTSIKPGDAKAVASILLENSSLRAIALEKNSLGNSGAQVLAKAIPTCSNLEAINLTDNEIEYEGALAFLPLLHTTYVRQNRGANIKLQQLQISARTDSTIQKALEISSQLFIKIPYDMGRCNQEATMLRAELWLTKAQIELLQSLKTLVTTFAGNKYSTLTATQLTNITNKFLLEAAELKQELFSKMPFGGQSQNLQENFNNFFEQFTDPDILKEWLINPKTAMSTLDTRYHSISYKQDELLQRQSENSTANQQLSLEKQKSDFWKTCMDEALEAPQGLSLQAIAKAINRFDVYSRTTPALNAKTSRMQLATPQAERQQPAKFHLLSQYRDGH